MRKKLRSSAGESLIETIVGGLVIALAAVLLFSMVQASSRMVQKSDQIFKENIEEKNDVETGSGENVKQEKGTVVIQRTDQTIPNDISRIDVQLIETNDSTVLKY